MRKLFLLILLSLFSVQSLGSCPDGSDPVKSISDDGTFFIFNCSSNDSLVVLSNKSSSSKKVKPKELEASIKSIGEFDLKRLGENSNPSLYARFSRGKNYDINQDGYDDIVAVIHMYDSKRRHAINGFSKPFILFWNNEIKEYVVDKNVQKSLPFLNYPRRIKISTNPKTGLIEIFIADTGQDLFNYDFSKGIENLPPNCGGQNHLITFDPSTGEVAEIKLPTLWDYSHGLAAEDINGDGVTDYVVLNSPYIRFPSKCQFKGADYTNENYILYSNNNGGFEKVNITLNFKGWTSGGMRTHPAGAIAIDKNDVYLILGSADFSDSLYAFKQESKSSFIETSQVAAPSFMSIGGGKAQGVEVQYVDIDNDGSKEVISALVNSNHAGRYIQILDFKEGIFTDRKDRIIQSEAEASKGRDWCSNLFYNEQTFWDEPILTCGHSMPLTESRGSFYVWNNNKLQLAKLNFKALNEIQESRGLTKFFPVNHGKQTFFVGNIPSGKKKIDGVDVYNSTKLYLIQPPLSKEELRQEKIISKDKASSSEKEKIDLLSKIMPSDAFDAAYEFTLASVPKDGNLTGVGYGTLEINKGIVTLSKDTKGIIAKKYDRFEGRINRNGDIVAAFYFHPCRGCGLEDKLVVFRGSINKKKLSGMYDDIKLYFYLVKK